MARRCSESLAIGGCEREDVILLETGKCSLIKILSGLLTECIGASLPPNKKFYRHNNS